MNYTIALRILPEIGKKYAATIELGADGIADAIRKIAEEADRHERWYKEFTEEASNDQRAGNG
jgi:hypothetical protein